VRSTAKIGPRLLESSPVQFVGTATSGFDHVDRKYLAERGIHFAHAPGSNAESVAEYFVAAMLEIARRKELDLSSMSVGVIGCGHVGREVMRVARGLGMTCIANDPPLARSTAEPLYRPLEEALTCDVVTLHVPLTHDGPDATHHMVNEEFLARMKLGAIFVNAARGGVVDSTALCRAVDRGQFGACVLDTFEGEPGIVEGLVERADIATPHIAGHSFDGKVKGTVAMYDAFCAFQGVEATWNSEAGLPPAEHPTHRLDPRADDALRRAVSRVYDIMIDHDSLQPIVSLSQPKRGSFFSKLRDEYRVRRSFSRTCVRVDPPDSAWATTLTNIGFTIG